MFHDLTARAAQQSLATAITKPLRVVYLVFNSANAREMRERWVDIISGTRTLLTPTMEGNQITDLVLNTQDHIEVNAYAGTGKTSMVEYVLWRLHTLDLLASIDISTYHSFGLKVMRNYVTVGEVDKYSKKYYQYFRQRFDHKLSKLADKLLSRAKGSLSDGSAGQLRQLCLQFDIELPMEQEDKVFDAVSMALDYSIKSTGNGITFDDMPYVPAACGMQYTNVDLMIVDEAQDSDTMQMYFPGMCAANGARVMFVGDRYQAIYGWRGADSNAMTTMGQVVMRGTEMYNAKKGITPVERKVTKAQLTETFRCPQRVVDAVKGKLAEWGGGEYRTSKPGGMVAYCKPNYAESNMKLGDLVLCRTNADLLTWAFKLVRNRVPVTMRGRDFGEGLIRLVEKITASSTAKDEGPGKGFVAALMDWQAKEQQRLLKELGEEWAEKRQEQLNEKVDCLMAIYDGVCEDKNTPPDPVPALTMGTLITKWISNLFGQEGDANTERDRVVLSTVHRAKGGQARHVWILRPDLLPRMPRAVPSRRGSPCTTKKPKLPDEQENFLAYVAITRALESVTFVTHEGVMWSSIIQPEIIDFSTGEVLAEGVRIDERK